MTRASKWLVGEATSPSTEVAGEATGGAGDGKGEQSTETRPDTAPKRASNARRPGCVMTTAKRGRTNSHARDYDHSDRWSWWSQSGGQTFSPQ